MGKRRSVAQFVFSRQISGSHRSLKYDVVHRILALRATDPEKNETCSLPGHIRSTFLVDFSRDGKKIASTHGDHSVRISDLVSGQCIATLTGHPRTPWCLAFHPTSSDLVASGCLGGQIRIWDIRTGCSETWQSPTATIITSLTFHPSQRLLVFSTTNRIYFWDWRVSEPFAFSQTANTWVRFDHLGHRLFTGIANALTIEPAEPLTARPPTRYGSDAGPPRLQELRSHYRSLLERYEWFRREQSPYDRQQERSRGGLSAAEPETTRVPSPSENFRLSGPLHPYPESRRRPGVSWLSNRVVRSPVDVQADDNRSFALTRRSQQRSRIETIRDQLRSEQAAASNRDENSLISGRVRASSLAAPYRSIYPDLLADPLGDSSTMPDAPSEVQSAFMDFTGESDPSNLAPSIDWVSIEQLENAFNEPSSVLMEDIGGNDPVIGEPNLLLSLEQSATDNEGLLPISQLSTSGSIAEGLSESVIDTEDVSVLGVGGDAPQTSVDDDEGMSNLDGHLADSSCSVVVTASAGVRDNEVSRAAVAGEEGVSTSTTDNAGLGVPVVDPACQVSTTEADAGGLFSVVGSPLVVTGLSSRLWHRRSVVPGETPRDGATPDLVDRAWISTAESPVRRREVCPIEPGDDRADESHVEHCIMTLENIHAPDTPVFDGVSSAQFRRRLTRRDNTVERYGRESRAPGSTTENTHDENYTAMLNRRPWNLIEISDGETETDGALSPRLPSSYEANSTPQSTNQPSATQNRLSNEISRSLIHANLAVLEARRELLLTRGCYGNDISRDNPSAFARDPPLPSLATPAPSACPQAVPHEDSGHAARVDYHHNNSPPSSNFYRRRLRMMRRQNRRNTDTTNFPPGSRSPPPRSLRSSSPLLRYRRSRSPLFRANDDSGPVTPDIQFDLGGSGTGSTNISRSTDLLTRDETTPNDLHAEITDDILRRNTDINRADVFPDNYYSSAFRAIRREPVGESVDPVASRSPSDNVFYNSGVLDAIISRNAENSITRGNAIAGNSRPNVSVSRRIDDLLRNNPGARCDAVENNPPVAGGNVSHSETPSMPGVGNIPVSEHGYSYSQTQSNPSVSVASGSSRGWDSPINQRVQTIRQRLRHLERVTQSRQRLSLARDNNRFRYFSSRRDGGRGENLTGPGACDVGDGRSRGRRERLNATGLDPRSTPELYDPEQHTSDTDGETDTNVARRDTASSSFSIDERSRSNHDDSTRIDLRRSSGSLDLTQSLRSGSGLLDRRLRRRLSLMNDRGTRWRGMDRSGGSAVNESDTLARLMTLYVDDVQDDQDGGESGGRSSAEASRLQRLMDFGRDSEREPAGSDRPRCERGSWVSLAECDSEVRREMMQRRPPPATDSSLRGSGQDRAGAERISRLQSFRDLRSRGEYMIPRFSRYLNRSDRMPRAGAAAASETSPDTPGDPRIAARRTDDHEPESSRLSRYRSWHRPVSRVSTARDEHANIESMASHIAREINVLSRQMNSLDQISEQADGRDIDIRDFVDNARAALRSSERALHSSERLRQRILRYPEMAREPVPRITITRAADRPQGDVQNDEPPTTHPPDVPLSYSEPSRPDVPSDPPHPYFPQPYLHPHYADSILGEGRYRPTDALQFAINRTIAGAFLGTGEPAVASNINNMTHRIQMWDFTKFVIPDLTLVNHGVVVGQCKLHNDASVAISQDSTLLATFVPSHRGFPDSTILAVFSLRPESLGQCLHTQGFGPNVVAVSISPLNNYVVVGMASRTVTWVYAINQVVAQIYKLTEPMAGEFSMQHVTNLYHPYEVPMRSPVSLNSIRWIPRLGEGLVYGTNRGTLHICRPGCTIITRKAPKVDEGDAEDDDYEVGNLSSFLSSHRLRRTAGTQTDNPMNSYNNPFLSGLLM